MWNRILNLIGLERRGTLAAPDPSLLALFTGITAGLAVTPTTALRSSTTAAAVRVISETAGSLPVQVFKRNPDGTRARDLNHPASVVLSGAANPWTGAAELRMQIQTDALLHRYGGFAQVVRAGGKVQELHRLAPMFVTPEIDDATGEPQYRVRVNGGSDRVLGYADVIHITTPGATFDRPWCLIDIARDAIALDMVMAEHQRNLFARGARPSGVLKIKGKLGDDAYQRPKASWQQAHGGTNSGGTAILEDEADFQPITFNSVDLQFLELRKLTIEEIARVFKVPATLLGILDRATWRNVEELARQFLQMCLMPWLEQWQSALDRALFIEQERGTYFVEFVIDDLLRGDTAARNVALRNAVGGPWLTA
jgi:HK97 family phage portal protein